MEALPYDQYSVRVDGSGRLTRRNRRFLKAYKPAQLTVSPRQQSTHYVPLQDIGVGARNSIVMPPSGMVDEVPFDGSSTHDMVMEPDRPVRGDNSSMVNSEQSVSMENILRETIALPETRTVLQHANRPRGQESPVATLPKREPLALRRLRDHNSPGLRETI